MAGLTGARLAIYDELLRKGVMDYARIARVVTNGRSGLEAAFAWLARHYFLRETGGCWAANPPAMARYAYEQQGPDSSFPEPVGPVVVVEPVQGVAERVRPVTHDRPVQTHQAQIFEMAGYGF